MPLTAFPGGISSFGQPVLGAAQLERYWGGGQILWVGNRSGLPSGDGSTPDFPLASLFGTTGALAKLNGTTSRGHVIFVLPGHAENITGADFGVDTGAANAFSVVGLGVRTLRPTFTFTAAASQWIIDTADVTLDNLRFVSGMAKATGTTLAVDVTAAGCTMRNCFFQVSDGTNSIVTCIRLSSGANDFTGDAVIIQGNAADAVTDTFLTNAAVARLRLLGCKFSAALGTGEGLVTMATAAPTDVLIDRCHLENRVTNSTVALKGIASATGIVRDTCLGVTVADGAGVGAAGFNTKGNLTFFNTLTARIGLGGIIAGTATTV